MEDLGVRDAGTRRHRFGPSSKLQASEYNFRPAALPLCPSPSSTRHATPSSWSCNLQSCEENDRCILCSVLSIFLFVLHSSHA
ncbi:unnamed protein product [Urochloa humidicola]